ncbi:hypothetical protein H9L39_04899 [Fusarium oxysporum f. sp. albedinis]|nr:hypothetical protein H9L39_04899 [Fusarium oxysporum f. sp. albedinis]
MDPRYLHKHAVPPRHINLPFPLLAPHSALAALGERNFDAVHTFLPLLLRCEITIEINHAFYHENFKKCRHSHASIGITNRQRFLTKATPPNLSHIGPSSIFYTFRVLQYLYLSAP